MIPRAGWFRSGIFCTSGGSPREITVTSGRLILASGVMGIFRGVDDRMVLYEGVDLREMDSSFMDIAWSSWEGIRIFSEADAIGGSNFYTSRYMSSSACSVTAL